MPPEKLRHPEERVARLEGRTAAAVTITIDTDGQRLDRALQQRLLDLSRSRLKQLILSGQVANDGNVIRDPSRKVRAGQTFVVILPEPDDATPQAQAIPLDIRFEDAHLIVIDKPAGLVVHPAPGNPDGTLVNALIAHCGASLAGIGGVRRPGIVHRLDKDTSGLMVVAKTEAAHRALSADFAARRISRAYAAAVWGVPLPTAGEIEGNIGRSMTNRKKMAVVGAQRGKPAVTRYKVERAFADTAALIECRLLTGRTHQIRVHLAERGHPLIGDPVYGGRAARRFATRASAAAYFPRQALHARHLGFNHPASGEYLAFDSDLPDDMKTLLTSLEGL
ncbi:MAG TPA: RluA family pseudouridine synthase [Stellaceae bacterium]|jgi:23S rRNA pseudouridine1911/1915/1917 synthase|nr:RluA family pseudouridine synthase [Stellaceae bacterium]